MYTILAIPAGVLVYRATRPQRQSAFLKILMSWPFRSNTRSCRSCTRLSTR